MQLQIPSSKPAEIVCCEQMVAADTTLIYGSMNPHGTEPYRTTMRRNPGSPYGIMLKCTYADWSPSWDREKKQWRDVVAWNNGEYRQEYMNTQDPT